MAEEKKESKLIKIIITDPRGWQRDAVYYPENATVSVDEVDYKSMKNAVKHEVVK